MEHNIKKKIERGITAFNENNFNEAIRRFYNC